MRVLRSVLFLLFSVASCSNTSYRRQIDFSDQQPSLLADIGDAVAGVVQVYSVNAKDEGISRGSGVVIFRDNAGSLVLTARHMTEGAGDDSPAKWIIKKNGLVVKARCIKRGATQDEDWALLESSYPVGDAVPVLESHGFRSHVRPYEDCVAIGYALGFDTLTVTLGHIQDADPNSSVFRMSSPIIFGNSGGGLFVTDSGRLKLAGITVAVGGSGTQAVPHLGFSVSLDTIRRRGGLTR